MATKDTENDHRELFRSAVSDAVPLDHEQMEPYRRRLPPRPLPKAPQTPAHDPERGAGALCEADVETGEELLFCRPGVQKRVLRDLRRGAFELGLELDLHGMTVDHARYSLDAFLRECQRRRVRCAGIVHGKGYRSEGRPPVLKRKVNYWLRLREEVLAFCSATRRDGGTGAVYVLLRNPSKSRRER